MSLLVATMVQLEKLKNVIVRAMSVGGTERDSRRDSIMQINTEPYYNTYSADAAGTDYIGDHLLIRLITWQGPIPGGWENRVSFGIYVKSENISDPLTRLADTFTTDANLQENVSRLRQTIQVSTPELLPEFDQIMAYVKLVVQIS